MNLSFSFALAHSGGPITIENISDSLAAPCDRMKIEPL